MSVEPVARLPQDLHIHTVYSTGDSAVRPEQTVELVTRIRHADVLGVSDHFEYILGETFERYSRDLRSHELYVGTEVDGWQWVERAVETPVDYYVYHCRDTAADYSAAERLAETGRPVIIAHPLVFPTDLDRVPEVCLIEINNRYIWRGDWRRLSPYVERFRFVIGSDAHQPNWLGQNVARTVAAELGIEETVLFGEPVLSRSR